MHLNTHSNRLIHAIVMMLSLALGACQGKDDARKTVSPNDADATTAKLAVANAVVLDGEAPTSTAIAEAPDLTALVAGDGASFEDIAADSTVDVDFDLSSLDGVSAILARVSGAGSYFQVNNPEVSEGEASAAEARAKAGTVGTTFRGRLNLQVPADFTAQDFCFEVAGVDRSGRVSNYRKICFYVPDNIVQAGRVIANAGPDRIVTAGSSASLAGQGFQLPDNSTTLSYVWRQVDGPAATLDGSSTASLNITAPSVTGLKVLEFRMTVTGDGNQTDTDTARVFVLGTANQPPTVNAGSDRTVTEGALVVLGGIATDVDGTVALLWEQLSGPAVTLSDTAVLGPSFTAPLVTGQQTVELKLTATDDDSVSVSDTVRIVINGNTAPVAGAASFSTLEDTTLTNSLATFAGDAQSDALSFSLVSAPASGALNLLSNGSFLSTNF